MRAVPLEIREGVGAQRSGPAGKGRAMAHWAGGRQEQGQQLPEEAAKAKATGESSLALLLSAVTLE